MQTKFKKIAFIENEMQQDFEKYLCDTFFTTADFEISLKSLNNETLKLNLNQTKTKALLNNQAYKNDFILSAFNSNSLTIEYSNIVKTTNELIAIINKELNK
jgi:ankyrin repeat protein